MISLERDNVRVGVWARDKTDAIRKAGQILVEGGFIDPPYVDSMLRREQVTPTYLGNGIAIPHGLPQDRDRIRQTGLAVLQVPDGVEWNPGETVHLVVAIAARSDEHIGVLAKLTDVLEDEERARELAQTRDSSVIAAALDPAGDTPAAPAPPIADAFGGYGKRMEVQVPGATGLHARPASVFVDLAKNFRCDIRVSHGGKTANGKSLVSMLRLGVEQGGIISISADGPDAGEALQALQDAVASGLGEEIDQGVAVPPPEAPAMATTPRIEIEPGALRGVPASPGLAIAPIHHFRRTGRAVARDAVNPAAERADFDHAMDRAGAELEELIGHVQRRAGATEAAIFRAHRGFLDDPELVDAVAERIEQGRSAAWAWREAVEERAAELAALNDPLPAARANDLRDVGARVLRLLNRQEPDGAAGLPGHEIILVAEDLSPSDTAALDPARVRGLCTALGGPNSHTAILARSLDIPAVVGAGQAVLDLADGAMAVLDGTAGYILPDPDDARIERARAALAQEQERGEAAKAAAYRPAITLDGHRIEVAANIGAVPDAGRTVEAGGEAVGLLRTEFLFQDRTDPPTEAEQYAAYRTMAEALGGLPLIVRTLDAGGDKPLPYLHMPHENNPFLGKRGLRLSLVRPDLFRTQIRAILRAAVHGSIKIMFPMVASLEEFRAARAIVEELRRELNAPPVEVGIMVEVPSSALMADVLAQEVDFFSIGTNDLTQYVLAIDRGHPDLARQADGLHPAVLRMVDRTVRAAHAQGKWVGVCGNLAADPAAAPILVGLDVDELSVSVPNIPALKAQVRDMDYRDARELARRALECRAADEVRALTAAA
jgi:phosphoenolpyruvate-protein phosphotransferase